LIGSTGVPAVRAGAFAIWTRAVQFHWNRRGQLAWLLPALCVPFLSDVLHSVLIAREARDRTLDPKGAVMEALRALPSLLRTKLALELRAVAWSFVPIYGMIQGARHRVAWAMTSNVLVFERLRGAAGYERCMQIADGLDAGLANRTLFLAPFVPIGALFLVWTVLATWVERDYSYTTWLVYALLFYVALPGSAAVNSFLYLEMTAREHARDLADPTTSPPLASANVG
jgi:hypothetical protein